MFDHGLLYGDGIFEGIRFYNGRVFKLAEHLERLWDSARAIASTIPMTLEEMEEAALETSAKWAARRLHPALVTRGKGDLGLQPATAARGPP